MGSIDSNSRQHSERVEIPSGESTIPTKLLNTHAMPAKTLINNKATLDARQCLLSKPDPGRAVLAALEMLLIADEYLLKVDASECAITHRLGMYLQNSMPEWHVDCEYNRNSNNTKQLPNPKQIKIDNENRRNVLPDIIVHRRSTRSNHLVIEVKKSSNGECRNPDYTKLRAFQSDKKYNYKNALFLELGVLNKTGEFYAEWVDSPPQL